MLTLLAYVFPENLTPASTFYLMLVVVFVPYGFEKVDLDYPETS